MPKIPSHAKKVFSWIIFDVYHWEQEMFDWSLETFEMLKRKDAITVFPITKDKKVIIIKEIQPWMTNWKYWIPAWWVEEWEESKDTAKRELLEETGYRWEFELNQTLQYDNSKIDCEFNYYIATNCVKIAEQSLDSWEQIVPIEMAFDELLIFIEEEKTFDKYQKKFIEEQIIPIKDKLF